MASNGQPDAGLGHAPAAAPSVLLDDLRARLRATRRVPLPEGLGWDRGTDPDYLTDLLGTWADDFDWEAQERRLLDLPWARTGSGPTGLRSIHARAVADGAATVVLLHGWPDSFLRFERALPLLADLNVVVPCLPGYPYADVLSTPGMTAGAMADAVAAGMAELGHSRYVVSGGDIGAHVAANLAAAHPDHVAALHLTDLPLPSFPSIDGGDLTEEEQRYLSAVRAWSTTEGAYAREQSTKPHTLAVGLGDSPAGLAAWIVEKLRAWSDCDGDVESVWSRDELLTWLTLYWVTGTIGTSFSPYVEQGRQLDRVGVPAAFQLFPLDMVPAPRHAAERFFDVRAWIEEPTGGHFGAWERPDAFTAGLRRALALA